MNSCTSWLQLRSWSRGKSKVSSTRAPSFPGLMFCNIFTSPEWNSRQERRLGCLHAASTHRSDSFCWLSCPDVIILIKSLSSSSWWRMKNCFHAAVSSDIKCALYSFRFCGAALLYSERAAKNFALHCLCAPLTWCALFLWMLGRGWRADQIKDVAWIFNTLNCLNPSLCEAVCASLQKLISGCASTAVTFGDTHSRCT